MSIELFQHERSEVIERRFVEQKHLQRLMVHGATGSDYWRMGFDLTFLYLAAYEKNMNVKSFKIDTSGIHTQSCFL